MLEFLFAVTDYSLAAVLPTFTHHSSIIQHAMYRYVIFAKGILTKGWNLLMDKKTFKKQLIWHQLVWQQRTSHLWTCTHHISVIQCWEINYICDVSLCKLAYNHPSHSNVLGSTFPGMPVNCHHLDTAVIIYYTQHQLGAGIAISRHHPTIKSNIGASNKR